jgi:glycosyltransferase involved in cell wall biosynthesis
MNSSTGRTVSVALPTYNGDSHLEELLDSILNQTLSPTEIVISDDGSTDETLEILEAYAEQSPDISRLSVTECNLGVAKNFERAIRNCTSSVIALADQDDVWVQEKLERQLTTLQREDAGMVFHNSTIVTEDLTPVGSLWDSVGFNPSDQTPVTLFEELLKRNYVQGTTIAFEAGLTNHLLPLPDAGLYDHHLALLGHIVAGIHPVNDSLLLYRQHTNQDRGAPPGFYSPLTQVRIGLNKEPDKSVRDAKRMEILDEYIQEIPKESFNLAPSIVYRIIEERLTYDECRRQIHTGDSWTHSVRAYIENIRTGRYARFGYGRAGSMSIGRDLLGLFQI